MRVCKNLIRAANSGIEAECRVKGRGIKGMGTLGKNGITGSRCGQITFGMGIGRVLSLPTLTNLGKFLSFSLSFSSFLKQG